MKARSASAFSSPSHSDPVGSGYSSPHHETHSTPHTPPHRKNTEDKARTGTFGFREMSLPEVKEEESQPTEASAVPPKETDAILSSLLQNGGLLAAPTVSPHFGRFCTPPRHDPFIRSEPQGGSTEGMEIDEDR
eukprot:TRINITY_DN2385_c0_g1_i2.p1 TRINITY_DN2385_c0_g1~~TRINITY_DN2385_c0_g1_i2.p1  ORF type:complete len:134 (-),score=26.01 TRINITY_DN2385_c0_g1_i2:145-546(-)